MNVNLERWIKRELRKENLRLGKMLSKTDVFTEYAVNSPKEDEKSFVLKVFDVSDSSKNQCKWIEKQLEISEESMYVPKVHKCFVNKKGEDTKAYCILTKKYGKVEEKLTLEEFMKLASHTVQALSDLYDKKIVVSLKVSDILFDAAENAYVIDNFSVKKGTGDEHIQSFGVVLQILFSSYVSEYEKKRNKEKVELLGKIVGFCINFNKNMRYDNVKVIKHHLSMLKEYKEIDAQLSINKLNGNSLLKRFICVKGGGFKFNDLIRASLLGVQADKISCRFRDFSIEKTPGNDCSITVGDKVFTVKRITNLAQFEDLPNYVYVFKGDIKTILSLQSYFYHSNNVLAIIVEYLI